MPRVSLLNPCAEARGEPRQRRRHDKTHSLVGREPVKKTPIFYYFSAFPDWSNLLTTRNRDFPPRNSAANQFVPTRFNLFFHHRAARALWTLDSGSPHIIPRPLRTTRGPSSLVCAARFAAAAAAVMVAAHGTMWASVVPVSRCVCAAVCNEQNNCGWIPLPHTTRDRKKSTPPTSIIIQRSCLVRTAVCFAVCSLYFYQ